MNRYIIIAVLFLFIFGCKSTNVQTFEYFEQEKIRIYEETEKILLALGYENALIFVYYHSNFDGPIISKQLYHTIYEGTGYNLEGFPEIENNIMPTYENTSNMHGRVEQYVVNNNYLQNYDNIKSEIIYSYISILIIIDNVSDQQKDELIKIFKSYLLNNERNDNIYIVSRKQ